MHEKTLALEEQSLSDPLTGLRNRRGISALVEQALLASVRSEQPFAILLLDLDRFMGGYPAAVAEVGQAIARVRAAGKPVLSYATGYSDSAYLLAANASEIWVDPIGGTLFSGPGGSRLYYKGLIDKLGVTAHVYKVGKFKSAVEPYILTGQSPEVIARMRRPSRL